MKVLYLKYGLTALMMAFAAVMLYSCSNGNKKTVEEIKTLKQDDRGIINGHKYVELAGIKVATENVGAVNGVEAKAGPAAEDNVWGCYYYTQENAKKAAESWGGTWKLPSEAQWQKLIDECNWEWKEDYYFGGKTMNGYIVSDKYDSSKSIFLPAAGFCLDGSGSVYGLGYDGYYWSAGLRRYLSFDDGVRGMSSYGPDDGVTVRPVVAEGQSSSTTQTEQSSSTTEIKIPGQINGHAYVELAGIKVATENVGAVNGVEATAGPAAEYNVWGCYYYAQENAKKAAESWGGTWTLPSEAQWQKLIDECNWEWKEDYYFGGKTMTGYIVSDKYDSSKSIFLPAAGFYDVYDHCVTAQGLDGYYWSADDRRYLGFYRGDWYMSNSNPYFGKTVRPVSE